MTKNKILEDHELDDLLSFAAANQPNVSDALSNRILADAEAVANARPGLPEVARPRASEGWIGNLITAIGGWPAMAGLATATVAGVWIGVAPPESIDRLADTYLSSDTSYDLGDFMPSIDDFLYEG